jgi:hypothetical protein
VVYRSTPYRSSCKLYPQVGLSSMPGTESTRASWRCGSSSARQRLRCRWNYDLTHQLHSIHPARSKTGPNTSWQARTNKGRLVESLSAVLKVVPVFPQWVPPSKSAQCFHKLSAVFRPSSHRLPLNNSIGGLLLVYCTVLVLGLDHYLDSERRLWMNCYHGVGSFDLMHFGSEMPRFHPN